MSLTVPGTAVLLPASIVWLDRRIGLFRAVPELPQSRWLAARGALAERHRGATAAIGLIALALSALVARRTELDTDLFHLRPTGSKTAGAGAPPTRAGGVPGPPAARLSRR